MARPPSEHVAEARRRLRAKLDTGLLRPGDRFPSIRALATELGISFQTAQRLVAELVEAGWLVGQAKSGTFVAGAAGGPAGVVLAFADRATRPESFGAKLLDVLQRRLNAAGIDWTTAFSSVRLPAERVPILWESHTALAACVAKRRTAVLVNAAPPGGLGALHIDSVAVDDAAGGAMAADLLIRRVGRKHLAVLAGPAGDRRSADRVAGFRSVISPRVVVAGGWYAELGRAAAPAVLAARPLGVFCGNDRLAEGLISWCRDDGRQPPPLVGFDDAPVAAALRLTTLAIPWDDLADEVVTLAKRRLAGDRTPAKRTVLLPVPVVRD